MAVSSGSVSVPAENESEFDRRYTELIAFDDTKAGVKGLVDAGIQDVPSIFNCTKFGLNQRSDPRPDESGFSIPIIDLDGIHIDPAGHSKVVQDIQDASTKWGFFQIINHGIPTSVLAETIEGIRRFHEQETEAKKRFYKRDLQSKVFYLSNFDLFQGLVTNWRDSFVCSVEPNPPDPEELPRFCR